MFQLGIILIDLTIIDNFKKIVEDNDLVGKVSPEALKKFRDNGYLKVWLDAQSIEVVGYTTSNKAGFVINSDFISYLKDMTPIKESIASDKVENEFYSMDSILDKISESGMGSLTKKELKFLHENS